MKETLKRIMMNKLSQLIEETTTDELIEMFQSEVKKNTSIKVNISLVVDRNEIKELFEQC